MTITRLAISLVAILTLSTTTCGVQGSLLVFVASSLTDVMTEAKESFEKDNPDAILLLNIASSSSLATQIREGAKADIFISANLAQIKNVEQEESIVRKEEVTYNSLAIVADKEDQKVSRFSDIAEQGVKLVIAAPEVPAGRYARDMLKAAAESKQFGEQFVLNTLSNIVSNETSVRGALAKVKLGEADATIAYVTDGIAAEEETVIVDIPDGLNQRVTYVAVIFASSPNQGQAKGFLDFLLSSRGQELMHQHGFESASAKGQ